MRSLLKTLFLRYEHFVKYCMIGVTGALLDFFIFLILTQVNGLFYQYANIISVSLGIINNFFLNARLNFKTGDRLWLRLGSFYGVGMIGMGLSAILLHVFIELLSLPPLLAKLMIIAIVTLVQFTLNKCITFRKTQKCSVNSQGSII